MSLFSRKLLSSYSSCNIQRLLSQISLYSTTTKKYNPKKPKSEPPPFPPPSPSSPLSSSPPPSPSLYAAKKDPFINWPKPSEIPWQAKVANTVNLIGHVKIPVQFQSSTDGKFWAGTIITQEPTSTSPLLWIPIIFEGDLAHIAACHLKENDHIYICGQLSADPPPFTMKQGEANVQVQVQSVNFVEQPSLMEKKFVPFKQNVRDVSYSVGVKHDGDSALTSWRELVDNPQLWKDHRKDKLSGLLKPKYPDFKRKDGSVSLWLSNAPAWVLSQVEAVELDHKIPQVKQVKGNNEDKWKELVENPSKWWDNRTGKFNKRSPDFKHKDTGDGLWLSDSPSWVLPNLPPPPPEKPRVNASFNRRDTMLS